MAGSLRELDQQRIEPPETVAPEHVDLVEEGPGLIELGVARGEEAVPEERDLLLQRAPGRDHAIQPGGSGGVKLAELRLIDVVATDEVLGHGLWVAGVEQFLDHRLVALARQRPRVHHESHQIRRGAANAP